MFVKKAGNRIYGAEFTAAEKKAMDIEIRRQLAEYTKKHEQEVSAIILWELHTQLGFGHDRLKKFYDNFRPALDDLINRYEMGDEDEAWLCTQKLKDYGFDISKMEED